MKLFGILLAATSLIASTVACPPPFNNWEFAPNATHNTSEIIEARLAETPNLAYTEAVKTFNNIVTVWPKQNGYTLLEYCFMDEATKRKFGRHVSNAVQMWRDKLGPPGPTSGHNLVIREVPIPQGEKQNPYCLTPQHAWDRRVDDSALQIMVNSVQGSYLTSTGYLRMDKRHPRDSHPHRLRADPTVTGQEPQPHADVIMRIFAHELGHAFGLYHEHQRQDRDQWFSFRCDSLGDYDRVWRAIQAAGGKKSDLDAACEDPTLAARWGFSAGAWGKYDKRMYDGSYLRLGSGPIDIFSIMSYGGSINLKPSLQCDGRYDSTWPNCVLCIWLPYGSGTDDPSKRTPSNCRPWWPQEITDGDKNGIKFLYPFA